jgi:hypothetical protein
MTDQEWLVADLPHQMIAYLQRAFRERSPKRKLRLYLCGCWHYLLASMTPGDLPSHLLVAERYADGQLSLNDMNLVRESVKMATRNWIRASPDQLLAIAVLDRHKELWDSALRVTALVIQLRLADAFPNGFRTEVANGWRVRRDGERLHLARMLRDIFSNHFRPVPFDPRWRTSDVLGLARAIYDDRAFDRVPILADALMDAGCADEQVLAHCRGDGPHVRGCWVVDLVLGKV